ncbi:hypothetical protein KFE98_16665 [bacterium SCSIO 12741]|nr:hypothetical protein KFE98_16665 [bacterium SCSIO 12741]
MIAMRWGLVGLVWLTVFSVQAQTYRFSELTLNDGLPQNSVNHVFQDRDGFIWLGTQDGMCRYDSYDFRYYRTGKGADAALTDGFVVRITQDTSGRIWASTRDGINVVDPAGGKTFTIKYLDQGREEVGRAMTRIGGYIYTRFGGQFFRIPEDLKSDSTVLLSRHAEWLVSSNTKSLFDVSYSKYWGKLHMTAFGLVMVDKAPDDTIRTPDYTFFQLPSEKSIYLSPNHQIWVISGLRVFRYVPEKKILEPVILPDSATIPLCIEFDDRGQVWIGTTDGIFICDEAGKLTHLTADQPGGISNNVVHHIYRDAQNNLWIGLANKGINLYKPHLDRFKYLDGFGTRGDMVWAIYQEDSTLWVGAEDGLYELRLTTDRLTENRFLSQAIRSRKKVGVIPERIMTLEKVGNELWCGARDRFYRIDLNKRDRVIETPLPETPQYSRTRPVTSIQEIQDEVWITTFFGTYIYNADGEWLRSRIGIEDSLHDLSTYYILSSLAHNQKMWVGTNDGIFRIDLPEERVTNYHYKFSQENKRPAFRFISEFDLQADSVLWIATFGGGVDRLAFEADTIQNFGSSAGLANSVVSAVNYDAQTGLWATHNQGVSLLPNGEDRFVNFDAEDGLLFQEAAISCIFSNSHREIAYGTPEGLIAFHPDTVLQPVDLDIPVYLTGLSLNYHAQDSLLQALQHSESVLDLFPGNKVVTLEFAALDYANPEEVLYFFQLEGFDEEWVTTTSHNRRVTYSNLPAGNYNFRVRAVNPRGQQSEVLLQVPLVVHPPFWQKPWFVVLVVLLIVAIGVQTTVFFSQRKLKQRLRELEMEQKVRSERERISKDLHDNVGSNLTYLVHSLDNLSYRIETKNEALPGERIDELSNSVRYTMEQLRESIWVLNKNQISLRDIEGKLMDFSSRMFSLQNIEYQVELIGNLNKEFKTSEAIQLFRIAQECIQNIVKHAQAKNVLIELTFADGKLRLDVKDDGIGFERNGDLEGHYGLQNMQIRAEETGGTFTLKTEPRKGTHIQVEIPIPDN